MSLTLGVDIGGTKVAGGVVDRDGTVLARLRRPTPQDDTPAIVRTIIEVIEELRKDNPVEAIGLSAAGFIDADASRVLFAPNVSWVDEPIRDDVTAAIELPVVVENDANAAAWGEARFGAGVGVSNLVCVAVGTGIGGGILLGGELYRGAFGVAAEFGHMRVVPDGRQCGCGNRGCWERYASGTALALEARTGATERPQDAARLLGLAGGDASQITGPMVTEAARDGDVVALAAFDAVGRWLGEGMADLSATLDPACYVVGGGVSEAGDLLLDPARRAYAAHLTGRKYRPLAEIRLAQLGNDAGLVGAADLARAALPSH